MKRWSIHQYGTPRGGQGSITNTYVILSNHSQHLEKYVKNEDVEQFQDTNPVDEDILSNSIQTVCSVDCVVNHIHRPNKKPKTKLYRIKVYDNMSFAFITDTCMKRITLASMGQ